MKIGMNEILSGIEYTAIQKITKELEKDGFKVITEYQASKKELPIFDIYAEKGEDKRIYELKIGKNRIQKRLFRLLQDEAKKLGAKLYIIYLEIPHSKEIEFEGIDQIIYKDLLNDLPSEIDSLSTHTTIESVDNIEINTISISDGNVKIAGSGTMYVGLQFGSNSDLRTLNGIEEHDSIDFFFKLRLNMSDNEIISHYYKIDTEQ